VSRAVIRQLSAALVGAALVGLTVYGGAVLLRKPRRPDDPPPKPHPEALAEGAREIFKANCYRCHGEDGAAEGGFNYVLDSRRLADRGKVVPGRPDDSPLLRRVLDGEMPPESESPRPGTDDVAILRRWVEAGAPDFTPAEAPGPALPLADLPGLVRDDLARVSERDRRFTRYFTLTHLRNAGLSEDELQTYRHALSKLLNALSWGRDIVPPRPVDPGRTVLRIDLRDYKWDAAAWERLLADYPYGSLPDSAAARDLAASAACPLPYVRADWFTAVACRPPLYYELLRLPPTVGELETLLRVDAAADIRGERVARAGFGNSGVSRNNRVIERHESAYGAYWRSYDFTAGTGAKNVFAHPLGPGVGPGSFEPDGGEMIFDLPNGLHAFFLSDGGGKRLDQAPVAVVSDPKRPERAVVAGVSCLSCHPRGLNGKSDQVRQHVANNPGSFPADESQTVLALYPPEDRFAALIRADNDRYRRAVERTGARWALSDPIVALAGRFDADLDLAHAAAEAGIAARELDDAIAASVPLGRALGALRSRGGTVTRRQFEESFGDLLRALKLGEPFRPAERPAEVAVKERVAVDLPEAFEQLRVGGGGQFLIFHFKKAGKLAIFDVFQARVVHEIEVPDGVRYAAGRDKLLVVLPGQKLVQRYDLHTFEREKVAPVPGGGTVLTALMGSDSPGPLALWCGGPLLLMDVGRMEPLEVEGNSFSGSAQWGFGLRVSADGQTFVGWNPSLTPARFAVMRLAGKKAVSSSADLGSFFGMWVTPNPDGSLIHRSDTHLFTADLLDVSSDWLRGWVQLPSDDPRFFLAARGTELSVCTTADRRPVFTLKDKALERMDGSSHPPNWYNVQAEPCVRYLPRANLLVFVRQVEKQVVVRPFDLTAELARAGKDYLFVVSVPKTHARAGGTFVHQLDVRSKAGGVTYKVEKGPAGMTVSPGGEVRWQVPADHAGKTEPVILGLRDAAGTEAVHSFYVIAD
jgi:mono/diheme cytochrome c family protein